MQRPETVRDSYDAVATQYVAHVSGELRHKPMDRMLLDEVADEASGLGPVCDLGCGPGHVSRYLHGRGADVRGIDLSPGLISQARRLNPGLSFEVADMCSLPVPDGTFAAVVAFYSMIHLDDGQLREAAGEICRVLRPGGWLLASFHRGAEPVHLDNWWGADVDLDFRFFQPAAIEPVLTAAGLVTTQVIKRAPYRGIEVETERFYIRAQKPLER